VKLDRLRRPKAACSPSYADCRPKINIAILWDTGHTKWRMCKGRKGQGKETKNSNVLVSTGVNIEILNWPGPPWEVD
jgi:hypothetical protein